jgi:hypothetical protein
MTASLLAALSARIGDLKRRVEERLETPLPLDAAALLALIETVDGTGSGLDADLLDGHDTSYWLTANAPDNWTPEVTQGSTTFGVTVNRARYMVVGQLVWISCHLHIASGTGEAAHEVQVGNLPYASSATAQNDVGLGSGIFYLASGNGADYMMVPMFAYGSTTLLAFNLSTFGDTSAKLGTGLAVQLVHPDELRFSCFYERA